ncbi:MAG: thymidylate synthase [Spirosomaceae bacterium]|jgi:thymidylate synthase|nr:thymidylate synthase [Spirosomataceae bacterium]
MQTYEFNGINSFLVGMSDLLLSNYQIRNVRNHICYELPEPVIIKISNPKARLVTISPRKWKFSLPYAESLWIGLGRNDMSLIGHYAKKLYEYAENDYMRAGYGARIRYRNGILNDYKIDKNRISILDKVGVIDQFDFVEKSFQKEKTTRQAIITIEDPTKDCFDENGHLKTTKDFPCTVSLQFILSKDNRLNLITHMRSNDFIWGASGVNIFNFTFIQEYFSYILNIPIGEYYHIVNNFHFYDDFKPMVVEMAKIKNPIDNHFDYSTPTFSNLSEFNEKIKELEKYEEKTRLKLLDSEPYFNDDFLNDWAKVFYKFNLNKKPKFANPILNQLSYETT